MTRYVYDGDSINVLYETDASGNVLRQYVYGVDGVRVAMKSKGQTVYYHYNPHGDVIAMTDQDGKTVATYEYDAWGNVLKSEATGIAAENPFGYAGYMYDKETSMYYLMARYYHPMHGVFISVDPDPGDEDDPITQNGYTYANNNPVMGVDPDGHWFWLVVNAGFAAYEGYKAYKSGQSWKGIATASLMGAVVGGRLKGAGYVGKQITSHLTRRHTVYVLKNSQGTVKYVGRTVNVTARKAAHKVAHPDLKFSRVRRNLNYFEARGVEHRFYLKYGGKKQLRNRIRPISKQNKNYRFYMQQSRDKYKKRR
ncbi:RHS repeat-associated core domain-containing protein [Microbacteriaceae bacterium 4G12]